MIDRINSAIKEAEFKRENKVSVVITYKSKQELNSLRDGLLKRGYVTDFTPMKTRQSLYSMNNRGIITVYLK